jgi:hypothetical protein
MSPYARRVYVTTLLMVTGFTSLSRLTQIAPPSTRFVSLGAGVRLGLPSHPASRRRSCLRLGVSTTSSSRGLSPPINRPCRAYSRRRLRRRAGDRLGRSTRLAAWSGSACCARPAAVLARAVPAACGGSSGGTPPRHHGIQAGDRQRPTHSQAGHDPPARRRNHPPPRLWPHDIHGQ